jgi:hypothetical protein
METLWKPQTSWKPSQRPAAETRKAGICSINPQTQDSENRLQGDGEEGVDGSSPSEGFPLVARASEPVATSLRRHLEDTATLLALRELEPMAGEAPCGSSTSSAASSAASRVWLRRLQGAAG